MRRRAIKISNFLSQRGHISACPREIGRGPLPSEGKGHTFESCRVRQFFFILQRDIRAESKTAALAHSSVQANLEENWRRVQKAWQPTTLVAQPPAAKVRIFDRLMRLPHRGGHVHHAQHRGAAGFQEPPNQQACENEKGDVEPARVIPSDGGLNDASVPLCRDKTEGPEYQLDNQRCRSHRRVEGNKQKAGHPPSVVFTIDVQDRKNDQIGEDEGDHATEADAAIPQYGSQRNIPDRANEGNDGYQRADDGPPQGCEKWMINNEERPPEFIGHPGGERTGDQETANDVEPDRGPIHHEIVADRGKAAFGGQSLPKRAALRNGHIHLRVTFHSTFDASVGLDLGLFQKLSIEKRTEEKN